MKNSRKTNLKKTKKEIPFFLPYTNPPMRE
jgi:hypothetical protein